MAKISFWTDLRNAAISRLLNKENPVNKSIIALIGGGSFLGTPKDYRSLSKAGYEMCATAYSCVSLIAGTASRIAWYVQRLDAKGNAKEIENHPVVTLLGRPNEVESGARFTEKVLSHLLLAGNSYILRVSGVPSGPPRFLYALRPDRMEINSDKSGRFLVASYTYNRGMGGPTFPADEVIHLMKFHPTHDFYGLSPIEVAALQIDSMNASAEWNARRLQNDMRPPGMLTAKSKWDLDKLKKMFKENYQGSENAGTPLVFSGEDIEWTDLSISPKDADWLQGQQFTLRQICSIFGVDPCLVGDSQYATYSNKQEARKGLYLEVILPLMDMLRDEYQARLFPAGSSEKLMYDRDSIEELQEDRGKKYAYLESSSFMTLNEKRVAAGLEEIEGADVILVPISNVPLEEATAPPEPMPDAFQQGAQDEQGEANDQPDEEVDEEPQKARKSHPARRVIKAVKKSFWTDPERKAKLWTNFETRARTREKSFLKLAEGYLKAQAARVKSAILAQGGAATTVGQVFRHADEVKAYVDTFWPWYVDHYRRAATAGMRAAKGELFDDGEFKADTPTSWTFTMTAEQERVLRDAVFNSGTKVTTTTVEKIYDAILEAQAENTTVTKFAQDIHDMVVDFSYGRARNWAQTESTKVDNMGQVDGFKQTEFVDMKGWLCSMLPTSRDAHVEADSQEVGVDEAFTVGGEALAYPGDKSGSPENICQCHCSVYPVVGGGV